MYVCMQTYIVAQTMLRKRFQDPGEDQSPRHPLTRIGAAPEISLSLNVTKHRERSIASVALLSLALNSISTAMIGRSGTILCHLSSSCLRVLPSFPPAVPRSLSVFPSPAAAPPSFSRIGASRSVVGIYGYIHISRFSSPLSHRLCFQSPMASPAHPPGPPSGLTFVDRFFFFRPCRPQRRI